MTAIDYAILLARIIRSSSRIKAQLMPAYGENFTVAVGTEQDRTDFQAASPYAFFFPLDEEAKPERIQYSVRMEIGLCSERVGENGGVPVLETYQSLAEIVPTALLHIAEHLPGVTEPPAHLASYRTSYEQETFPLVKAVVDIEINQPTTVGNRSVI